jgi:putative DNA primase/helicase
VGRAGLGTGQGLAKKYYLRGTRKPHSQSNYSMTQQSFSAIIAVWREAEKAKNLERLAIARTGLEQATLRFQPINEQWNTIKAEIEASSPGASKLELQKKRDEHSYKLTEFRPANAAKLAAKSLVDDLTKQQHLLDAFDGFAVDMPYQSDQPTRLTVGANKSFKGKTGKDKLSDPNTFILTSGSIAKLIEHITTGFAWMPSLVGRNHRRQQRYCNKAFVMALDCDTGWTMQEAIEHPLIKAMAAAIVPSSSHTPEHHKFRIIFVLDRPIEGHQNIRRYITALMALIPGMDRSCKDASRFFFGAEGAEVFHLNEYALLPVELLMMAADAIDASEPVNQRIAKEKREQIAKIRAEKGLQPLTDDKPGLVADEFAHLNIDNAIDALEYCTKRQAGGNLQGTANPSSSNRGECMAWFWGLCCHLGMAEASGLAAEAERYSLADQAIDNVRSFPSDLTSASFWLHAIKQGYKAPKPKRMIRDEDQPESEGVPDAEDRKCPYFESSPDRGLWYVSLEKNSDGGFDKVRKYVGNHLEAIAYINTTEGNGSSLHLEFKSIRHQIVRWTMPRAFIVAETAEMLGELVGRGYHFRLDKKKLLIEYLNSLGGEIETTYTVTDSTGWTKGSFVTQNKTHGDESLKFRDIEPSAEALSEVVGTLDDWKSQVAARCAGNSRLIFALGTAFAAPLLPVIGLESGGFHLIGGTSAGKTTTLKVAASVVGFKEIPHWRTTTNGLESIACAHNHTLLPLDEIGQADPKDVGAIAYMLANGQGKTRMNKNLTNRKPKTWQLLFLSSGEVGMGAYIAQAGLNLKGGQEVRMPDIPAVPPGSTTGVFENIHGCESSKQFAQALEYATTRQRGSALDEFLARLTADLANDKNLGGVLAKRMYLIAGQLSEGMIDHAVNRVANRFALVQVALGLAHEHGLLPFPVEQIEWAIRTVFADWLNHRGGDGSIEIKNACDRIERLLVANEFSDRVYDLSRKDEKQTIRNLLAYRTSDPNGNTEELWIPSSVFDKELCADTNKGELIKELQRRNWITPPREDGKPGRLRTLNGKKKYFIVFVGVPGVPGVPQGSNQDTEKVLDTPDREHQGKIEGVPGVLPQLVNSGVPDQIEDREHREHRAKMAGVPCSEHQNDCPVNDSGHGTPRTPGTPGKNDSQKISTLDQKSEAQWDED